MNFLRKYDMVILAILIYGFVLVTSFFHTVFYLSSFEPATMPWIAMFIALALDIALFYFVFAETVQRIRGIKTRDAKIAYIFLTLIVFGANWISMAYYFDFNKYPWKIFNFPIANIFPLISSAYIPFSTIYLARVGASFLTKAKNRISTAIRISESDIAKFIFDSLKDSPDLTIPELAKLIEQKFGRKIGKKTIRRIIYHDREKS